MRNTIVSSFVIVLLTSTICMGQSTFKGLEPGRSTRAEVEKILGDPLREVSDALSEYKSDKESERIYVLYRRQSEVVDRIELVYPEPIDRAVVIRSLNLPSAANSSQTNTKGKLEEYFSEKLLVLTYDGADAKRVSRLGYCSRELFDKVAAKTGGKVLGPDKEGWGFNDKTATILTYYGSTAAATCRADCEKNPKCMAYSWIKPSGILPGDPPMCYLMSAWIKMVEHPCCTSAVRNSQ